MKQKSSQAMRRISTLPSPRQSNTPPPPAPSSTTPTSSSGTSKTTVAATKAKPKPATTQQQPLFHNLSSGFSISPIRPSPSMVLLNKTAELIADSSESVERMPVNTTTQVFQIVNRKQLSSPISNPSPSLLAVFKPATDEQDTFVIAAQEKPILSLENGPEERALRERAAYVLDKSYNGFSKVPATVLAELDHSNGSLQQFIPNMGSVEDHPDIVFTAETVQRVAILDCRIFNLDRHGGNLLVVNNEEGSMTSSSFGLIPIDHSLSLPPWTDLSGAWFDWSFWPSSEEVLTNSVVEHVNSLNVTRDAKSLKDLGIRAECIATNTICTLVLKGLANTGVTLKNLAEMYQRPYPKGHRMHNDVLSPLEQLIKLAREKSTAAPPSKPFYRAFAEVLSEFIPTKKWHAFIV